MLHGQCKGKPICSYTISWILLAGRLPVCSPEQSQSEGQAEEKISNLDASDQNLLLRTLVHEGRCFSVDGQMVLRICTA